MIKLTAGQFAWLPALNETPGFYSKTCYFISYHSKSMLLNYYVLDNKKKEIQETSESIRTYIN